MRSEAGEVDAADERVVLERVGRSRRVFFVALHSEFERFQSAQREPTVERRGNGAGRVLQELDRLEHRGILGESRALNQVGVSGEIFRDAVNDDVGAEFERLLEAGRGEGVVDDHERAAAVREAADRGDVVDEQARIGGRFDPDELRPRGNRGVESGGVGEIELRDDDANRLEDFVEDAIGAAVDVGRHDDFVARPQIGLQDGVFGGEAGGETARSAGRLRAQRARLRGAGAMDCWCASS